MNNIIILNCKKDFPNLPELYNTLELKLLFIFYLNNGICYSGNINQLKSSRNIEIDINNNTISFCKRNSELQEINVTLPFKYIQIISKYTPFISYKHYYYISTILEHFNNSNLTSGYGFNEKNKNILEHTESIFGTNEQNINFSANITKISENKKNKINRFIQNVNKNKNISINLQGQSIKNALNIIKIMNEEDKTRYILLFVIYFFPLDVLDKSISTTIQSLYIHTSNTKDYLKRILLSYILHIYPNNNELANENTNLLFTYFYNEDLFKLYKKYFIRIITDTNIKKKYLNINSNSNSNGLQENNIDCKLHKFYSQRNSCTLTSYNLSSISSLTNFNRYSITNEMYYLLLFIQGKGNVKRKIIVNIDSTKNHSKSNIIIREKDIDYEFSYNLIKKIAEKSTYLSFHQLLTIKYIYNNLEFGNLRYNNKKNELFDYLITTIIYLYGNREFKDKIPKSSNLSKIELYNLPTKNGLNKINDNKKNEIINKVIKIYIYLHKQQSCVTSNKQYLSILNINQIINLYNQFMKGEIDNISHILNPLMYITSCLSNPIQELNILEQNVCLPIKSCKLERKSIISNTLKRTQKVLSRIPKIF